MARCIAVVHADKVNQTIKKLNCPSEQKVQLLDSIIETVKSKQVINPQKG